MSHHYAQVPQTYQLDLPYRLKRLDRANISAVLCLAGHIITISLLAALAARVVLSVLLMDNAVLHAITFITNPLVAPFSNIVSSMSPMIQAAAAIAYCVYFVLYRILVMTVRTSVHA
jgi:hypothetical protein